jgi:hypothetical protein
MDVKVKPYTLEDMIADVNRRRLTFSRWGDGEWAAVTGRTTGKNTDRHPYRPELTTLLRGVLESAELKDARLYPEYKLGMQSLAMREMGDKVRTYLATSQLNDREWVDADVIHRPNGRHAIKPLIEAINAKFAWKLGVGPAHLAPVFAHLGWEHVVVGGPDSLANQTWISWAENWIHAISRQHLAVPFIAVSAGPPAKYAIHRFHLLARGDCCIIDFGSALDPYAGKKSRGYMRKDEQPYNLSELL